MLTLFYGGFTQAHHTCVHQPAHFRTLNVTYWLAFIPLTNHIHIIDELSPDMTQKPLTPRAEPGHIAQSSPCTETCT